MPSPFVVKNGSNIREIGSAGIPMTTISHGHLDPPIGTQRADLEVPALPRHRAGGVDTVEEDIEEYLLEMDPIAGNRLEVPRQCQTELHSLRSSHGHDKRDGVAGELVEIDRLRLEFMLAEQPAHALHDRPGPGIDATDVGQDFADLALRRRAAGVQEHFCRLRVVQDGLERLVELVRDGRGDLANRGTSIEVGDGQLAASGGFEQLPAVHFSAPAAALLEQAATR